MKRMMAFILAVFIATASLPIRTAAETEEYMTEICTITLNEALKERYLDENSPETGTEAELIPYEENDGIFTIPLSSALHNMEFTNPQILLMDKKLELYKKQYSAALDKAVSAQAAPSLTDTDLRKQELLDWRTKRNNLQNLQYDREELVYSEKTELEKNYISAKQLQADKAVLEKELEKLEQTINQSKMKLELGLIKGTEIEDLNSDKLQLESQIKSTDRQLETVYIKIKQALGVVIDSKIVLETVNKEFSSFDESGLEERIQGAGESSHDIEVISKNLELTKLEYDIVTTYYEGDYPAQADSLEESIQNIEDSINTTKLSKEAELWNSYFTLKNQADSIEIERINVKLAQRDLESIKTKIEVNKAAASEELAATISLSKAENKLQSLINEYMLAQESFERELGEMKESTK